MIIDTHSHLSFKAYDNDRNEVIKSLKQEGFVCIDVGTKYETSKRAVELAEKYEGIYAAIGMHPIHIEKDGEEFDKNKYLELAKSKKVVAVGEIGLDYYYKPKTKTRLEKFKEKQKQVFLQQLDLARELDLPIIVHCRMAHKDTIEILKMQNVKGSIHCFTGSWEEAQKYLEFGFYLGINGIIDKLDLTEVIKNCPLDKILVETDCPYLTPLTEGKNKRNEPIFIKHVIQKISDIKGISFQEVAGATTQNAKILFKILNQPEINI